MQWSMFINYISFVRDFFYYLNHVFEKQPIRFFSSKYDKGSDIINLTNFTPTWLQVKKNERWNVQQIAVISKEYKKNTQFH